MLVISTVIFNVSGMEETPAIKKYERTTKMHTEISFARSYEFHLIEIKQTTNNKTQEVSYSGVIARNHNFSKPIILTDSEETKEYWLNLKNAYLHETSKKKQYHSITK
jgi:hypothetical protein